MTEAEWFDCNDAGAMLEHLWHCHGVQPCDVDLRFGGDMRYAAATDGAVATLDAVAEQLGSALGFAFERRDSTYWGEYCLYCGEQDSEVRIYRNEDPMHDPAEDPEEEQFFEPEFNSYLVLLDASMNSEHLARLRATLRVLFPGAVLIREE